MSSSVPTASGVLRRWQYQVDEVIKTKHKWNEPHAGWVRKNGEIVWVCPNDFPHALAEDLINDPAHTIPYHNPRAPGPNPDRLYTIHDRVLYRSMPTIYGRSFHAFPEDRVNFGRLPGVVRGRILAIADGLGCREDVLEFMDQI